MMTRTHFGIAGALACMGLAATAAPGRAAPPDLLIEAEARATVSDGPLEPRPKAPGWTSRPLDGASFGRVLHYPATYSAPEFVAAVLPVPAAGAYRLWIRSVKKSDAGSGIYWVIRDEAGEGLTYGFLDWVPPRVPTETPYEKPASRFAGKTGFIWESFDVTFERPLDAALSFGGGGSIERQIDCILLTADRQLEPAAMGIEALQAKVLARTPDAGAASPAMPPAPEGFTWSAGLPGTPDFFAGIAETNRRFWAGIINNGSTYVDGARMCRMGFNRDHGRGAVRWGIPSLAVMESLSDPEFVKAHANPTGRFVNAQGQVGTGFSLHYQPWVERSAELLKARVGEVLATDDGTVGFWRISAEEGGWLDYSPWAQEAFRAWLAAKHGTIETLNRRWGASYAGFSEIVPATNYASARACWLEFREFSGHAYAESVARRIAIIQPLDPKRRPCLGANSNLDIDVPYFMAFRPNDFEELIRVGLKDEKFVAFDIYCADDHMGSAIDFLTSLAQGRKLINQEFSNHVVDPRIAARTYWEQVGKGIHGIHLFMLQDGRGHATYPKWALLSEDGSPKQKLAAYSDAAQEVHRLEPLLMAAAYTHAVKPVALYWSRIDLGLDMPHDSFYGHSLNSPIHVYRTLRSLGYPVRWITPRQIAEGELAGVAALVMAGCNHVPQVAARAIEAWVGSGGAVIGDSWPGAFDEYGQPQPVLQPVFGVRPAPKKAAAEGSQLALQESRQGYGEITDAAVLREKYYEKVDEIAQQPGATHPVARALGDFMVAGVGLEDAECVAGKVVGLTHRGRPGFVVNSYGKGNALYSSLLLGTIYEAAPTRYEWDTTHAGLSYGRVLDAFLRYAGARPGSRTTGLAPRVAAKLRVESPLVTPEGNALIALTSMNDDDVKPFDLEVALPAKSGPFETVLVAVGGSRRLERVEHALDGRVLKLHMPAFDTHAMVLALKDVAPLVGLDIRGVERGPASLAMIEPGREFEVVFTIYNPSRRPLAPGELVVTAPAGWLQSAGRLAVGPIEAGGEGHGSVRVRAPEFSRGCRIEPLVARYSAGKAASTPATEMVWWGLKPQGQAVAAHRAGMGLPRTAPAGADIPSGGLCGLPPVTPGPERRPGRRPTSDG